MVSCPGCNRDDFTVLVSRDQVAEEIEFRREFFSTRMDGPLDPAEQKDRATVAHASHARILICRRCAILTRQEDQSPDFEEDRYAPFTMERMLRAHIEAYRRKEPMYRHLLPDGARVVEVGSYVETVQELGDRHIMPSLRPLNATAMREAERVEALIALPSWFEVTFSKA